MSSAALKRLSWEEYVTWEREAVEKSEFYDGEVFAMAGGSAKHSRISVNVTTAASVALGSRNCQVFNSDMRVLCPTGLGTYPDCSIVCGEPEFLDGGQDTLLNPLVIFEVLSPTTEAYDRGRKFAHYQSLPALQEYILISQNRVRIEHYARQPKQGQWLLTVMDDFEGKLTLPALEISLSLSELYAKVTFDETDDAGHS